MDVRCGVGMLCALLHPMVTTTKKNIGWEMTLDVLLIIAGGFAIALPLIAGIGFELLVGWLFSLSTHFEAGENPEALPGRFLLASCICLAAVTSYFFRLVVSPH